MSYNLINSQSFRVPDFLSCKLDISDLSILLGKKKCSEPESQKCLHPGLSKLLLMYFFPGELSIGMTTSLS